MKKDKIGTFYGHGTPKITITLNSNKEKKSLKMRNTTNLLN